MSREDWDPTKKLNHGDLYVKRVLGCHYTAESWIFICQERVEIPLYGLTMYIYMSRVG